MPKLLLKYRIFENYKENKDLRNKFYQFTRTVFPSIDFEEWYEQGYWYENYIPYSIIDDNNIISNVSVTKMNVLANDKILKGIQIGAVGTIPGYQNRGLSRYLMEYVINKYDPVCDIIFLFANETVLDFYPKFGFKPHQEFIFKSSSDLPKPDFSARKLNLINKSDVELINKMLTSRFALTKLFGAKDYDFITHWHLLNIFPDDLFFIENEPAIVICNEKEHQLQIFDIIYTKPINLTSVLSKIIQSQKIESIKYYFPPDQLSFTYDEVIEDTDSHLFIRGNFRLKDHQFKFPITAQA